MYIPACSVRTEVVAGGPATTVMATTLMSYVVNGSRSAMFTVIMSAAAVMVSIRVPDKL